MVIIVVLCMYRLPGIIHCVIIIVVFACDSIKSCAAIDNAALSVPAHLITCAHACNYAVGLRMRM